MIADPVTQAVSGCADADRLIAQLSTSIVPPDALHDALLAVERTGEPERLHAFCRRLQKRLERLGSIGG